MWNLIPFLNLFLVDSPAGREQLIFTFQGVLIFNQQAKL
jgi:hypothetical protein